MRMIHQIADPLRPERDGHRVPAGAGSTARWQQRAMLISVRRDLDEAADEQAYLEAEIARSREHAARLDAEAAAAAADGCVTVARELREELSQTYAFLAELAEVHYAVVTERGRLTMVCKRLSGGLGASDRPPERVTTGTATDRAAGPADGDRHAPGPMA